jgi:uncharacterized membrane protein YeaQ/YmgE (transglycosylase-associated protein family)
MLLVPCSIRSNCAVACACPGASTPDAFTLHETVNLFFKPLTMMSLIGTLFIGLIVGFIARALKPGDDKLGWIMTAILGVAGSFLAGHAGKAFGLYQAGQVAGFIASIFGAVVLLLVYALVRSKVK